VNGLWLTAASRTRDALLTFLGLVLLLAALDAFSRLSLDPDGRDRLLLWVCGGGAAALVVSALERFRPLDPAFRPWADLNRRAGTFTDPNALGVGIGLLVPLFAASLVARGTWSDRARRVFAILGLVAAPIALEASGSRTGLLLLGSAGLAAAVGLLRRRHVPLLPAVAAAAAAVFAGVLLIRLLPQDGGIASGGLLARLGAGLSSRSLAEFANHRFMFWRAAFEMTADEPLTGVGLAGFPYEFPVAWAKRHAEVHVTDGATNALLDVLSECGLPGLALALLAVVPLLVRALEAAFARGPIDPASRAAGAALAGLFVACQTGSHLRFFEVGLLASLAAGLLLVPRRSPRDGRLTPEPGVRPGRTAAILAGAGILGGAVAVLPTLKPQAAFTANPWVGVYPAPAADPYHWAGPLCYRGIRPGERIITFRIQNARPDGDPVTVRLDVDGRGETALEVPGGGETRDVAVPVPEGGRVLRLRANPSFVPDELDGKGDRRRLAVRLAGDEL
jgi:O-antigen ligase